MPNFIAFYKFRYRAVKKVHQNNLLVSAVPIRKACDNQILGAAYFGESFCAVKAKPIRLVSCRMCPCRWAAKANYVIMRGAIWLTKMFCKSK